MPKGSDLAGLVKCKQDVARGNKKIAGLKPKLASKKASIFGVPLYILIGGAQKNEARSGFQIKLPKLPPSGPLPPGPAPLPLAASHAASPT